jgi:hypothetical protein
MKHHQLPRQAQHRRQLNRETDTHCFAQATLKATNGKLSKREEQLGKSNSDFAVSKAEVQELKLRLEQVETKSGVDRLRAGEEIAELRAGVCCAVLLFVCVWRPIRASVSVRLCRWPACAMRPVC